MEPGGPPGAGARAAGRRVGAARSGAAALLVDVAGPTTLVVEGEDLTAPGRGLDAGPGRGADRLDSVRPCGMIR